MTVGESLKKIREEHNLTHEEIAKALGVNRSTYSYYEEGKNRIPLSTLVKLAKMYNCTVGYVAGQEENHPERRLPEGRVAARYEDGIAYLEKEEQMLIMCYRLIPDDKKEEALETLKNLTE